MTLAYHVALYPRSECSTPDGNLNLRNVIKFALKVGDATNIAETETNLKRYIAGENLPKYR